LERTWEIIINEKHNKNLKKAHNKNILKDFWIRTLAKKLIDLESTRTMQLDVATHILLAKKQMAL
jgi:hypothetical protein